MGRTRTINPDDIINKVFGKLTVLSYEYRDKHSNMFYSCKCNCGNITIVRRDKLISGNTQSCGCKVHDPRINPNDIVGKTFGELHVDSLIEDIDLISRLGLSSDEYVYKATCSCGKMIGIKRSALISDRVRSCGCQLEEYKATHNGMTPHQVIKMNAIKNKNRRRL